jgi:hypothetical protein
LTAPNLLGSALRGRRKRGSEASGLRVDLCRQFPVAAIVSTRKKGGDCEHASARKATVLRPGGQAKKTVELHLKAAVSVPARDFLGGCRLSGAQCGDDPARS